jgi:hypothetical protein
MERAKERKRLSIDSFSEDEIRLSLLVLSSSERLLLSYANKDEGPFVLALLRATCLPVLLHDGHYYPNTQTSPFAAPLLVSPGRHLVFYPIYLSNERLIIDFTLILPTLCLWLCL